jgi:hypothetical protein
MRTRECKISALGKKRLDTEMTMLGSKRELRWIFPAIALFNSMAPGLLVADDEGKANPSSKAASIKPDVPTPGLTERERWLLDRVEQLEKRVADLESKGNPAAAPAADASATQPASANATPSAAGAASLSLVRKREERGGEDATDRAVRVCGLYLVERQRADERVADGYEILYPGDPR